jgi:hypothetical protein
MILKNAKRKPYLDLECTYKNIGEYNEKYKPLLKKLQTDIITVFKTYYNEDIKLDDILFLNSSGPVSGGYKFSFHVIIDSTNRALYYTNSKYTNSSAYHLYTSLINLDAGYQEILDGQIYNTEPNMRIIGSAKYVDDLRTLVPVNRKTFKPIEISDREKLRYFLTYIDESVNTIMLITPIILQTTKSKNISATKTDLHKKLLKRVKNYHPTAISSGNSTETYHDFNYTDRKEKCPVSGKIHEGKNGFFVRETDRGYYLICHSNKCEGSIHIGYIDETSDFINSGYQIKQQYLTDAEDKIVKRLI